MVRLHERPPNMNQKEKIEWLTRSDGLDPYQILAELYHDAFCRLEHNDQCDWGYVSPKARWGKKELSVTAEMYLYKAKQLMVVFGNFEDAVVAINAVREARLGDRLLK